MDFFGGLQKTNPCLSLVMIGISFSTFHEVCLSDARITGVFIKHLWCEYPIGDFVKAGRQSVLNVQGEPVVQHTPATKSSQSAAISNMCNVVLTRKSVTTSTK